MFSEFSEALSKFFMQATAIINPPLSPVNKVLKDLAGEMNQCLARAFDNGKAADGFMQEYFFDILRAQEVDEVLFPHIHLEMDDQLPRINCIYTGRVEQKWVRGHAWQNIENWSQLVISDEGISYGSIDVRDRETLIANDISHIRAELINMLIIKLNENHANKVSLFRHECDRCVIERIWNSPSV